MSEENRYGEGEPDSYKGRMSVRFATPAMADYQSLLGTERGWSDNPVDDPMLRAVQNANAPLAWLPHQCDQWVIGGAVEVRQMIDDLWAALVEMERE